MFPKLCIYLIDKDKGRQDYLKDILDFVDGTLQVVEDSKAIADCQKRATIDVCSAVLIGPDLGAKQRRAIVDELAQRLPELPVFPIYTDEARSFGRRTPSPRGGPVRWSCFAVSPAAAGRPGRSIG